MIAFAGRIMAKADSDHKGTPDPVTVSHHPTPSRCTPSQFIPSFPLWHPFFIPSFLPVAPLFLKYDEAKIWIRDVFVLANFTGSQHLWCRGSQPKHVSGPEDSLESLIKSHSI